MVDLSGRKLGEFSGRKLGEFVLCELIGNGGYGSVYRGEQPLLKRHVAVKVLHTRHKSDVALERFEREAQIASRLDSPYAADVHTFGAEDDGLLWIAMELVQGITLSDWLTARGPMTLDQFVHFFNCIAEVIAAVHGQGIVHRDLKPSNVMVIERRGRLFPKILDFGIALVDYKVTFADASAPVPLPERARNTVDPSDPASGAAPGATHSSSSVLEYRLTPTGAMFGSAAYMSPEQWSNTSAVGPAADIYSLGIMAFQALTGRLPFSARNNDEYHQQHRDAKVPPLGDVCSPELDRIVQRALAKSPSDRHRDVLELASEFQAALRASDREQLRSSALQWEARDCAPSMLWGADLLSDLQGVTGRALAGEFSPLECSFVAASQRRARRRRWVQQSIGALAAALAVLGCCAFLLYRAGLLRRTADQIATEAEVEQGRQALLHGESSEAVRHLEQAYQRGDHSPGVAFMLARALQPRMSELTRLTASSGRMWSAAFAPDSKRVLTTDDKSARMWDASSGQLLFTMTHGDTVYDGMFSPDGTKIVTAGADGSVRIWSAASGALVRELRVQQSATKRWRYYKVAMSSHVVAAIDVMGKTVHVWDAETGTQLAELDNDAAEIKLLAFSADGHWLASSGRDEVRVFDTSTWQRTSTIVARHARSLAFDPTGPRLALGTYDGAAAIWEVPGGSRIRSLRGAGASVDAIAFSREGRLVATGSRDGTEQVWDALSGGLSTEFNSHHDKIYAVEFSPSSKLLLSAGADGAVVVSNVATGMTVATLEGPKGLIFAAHFDSESRRVVGASFDGTARVWDAAAPYLRWDSPTMGSDCDSLDNLIPDQRFIALGCGNHGTQVWDTARGELVAELPGVTPVDGDYASAMPALTATGDRVGIARSNTVEVYALPSGQLLRTVRHAAAVNAVAFAAAGHDLVSGAIDGSIMITRDERAPVALPSSSAGIDAAAILADGRIVVADARSRLRLIDSDRNALRMDVTTPSRIRLLRPSPDGTRLVTISTTSEQGPPVLWDLDRHRLVARLDGHVGRVFTARFIALGGRQEILTAGADGTARRWDAATGRPVQSLRGDSHFLADAALAPDGSVIVGGGSDGSLRFWDTSSGRLLWTMHAHNSYVTGVHYEGNELVTRGFAGDIARWSLPSSERVIELCHASTCTSGAPTGR